MGGGRFKLGVRGSWICEMDLTGLSMVKLLPLVFCLLYMYVGGVCLGGG
jgi:hypothetical protein